jgi:hypothetical protein
MPKMTETDCHKLNFKCSIDLLYGSGRDIIGELCFSETV